MLPSCRAGNLNPDPTIVAAISTAPNNLCKEDGQNIDESAVAAAQFAPSAVLSADLDSLHDSTTHATSPTHARLSYAAAAVSYAAPEDCPICYDFLAAPVTLECGHSYCRACFVEFTLLASNGHACPLCRRRVGTVDPFTAAVDLKLEAQVSPPRCVQILPSLPCARF